MNTENRNNPKEYKAPQPSFFPPQMDNEADGISAFNRDVRRQSIEVNEDGEQVVTIDWSKSIDR